MSQSTWVFLYGALASVSAMEALGLTGRAARVLGLQAVPGRGIPFEGVGPDNGDLRGVLVEAGPEAFARLQWLADIFCHAEWLVEADGTEAVIFGWGAQAGEARDWGGLGAAALPDLLSYYPETDPVRMQAFLKIVLGRVATRLAAGQSAVPVTLRNGAGRGAVRVSAAEPAHRGFFHLDDITLTHPRFDGGPQTVRRETFVGTDATLVLPFDSVADRLVLIEQFRVGPYRRGDPMPWMLEPVAGLIDPGETPESTAFREAVEETGITLGELVPMPGGYASPGATAEFFHMFVGLTDLSAYTPRQAGLVSEGEDILSHVVTLDEALALLGSGEAAVVPLAHMITWTALNRDRLRSIELRRRGA